MMVQHPISLMNQGALYWCFQLMYHLFQNSFWKGDKNFENQTSGPIYMEDPVWLSICYLLNVRPLVETHSEGPGEENNKYNNFKI